MKKSWKAWIATAAVIAGIGVVIVAGLNFWLTLLVRRQLDNNIASAGSMYMSYADVRLTVSGRAWIKDVYFRTDSIPFEDSVRQVVEARADVVSLDGINYFDWLARRQVQLRGLNIVNPVVRTRFVHDLSHGDEIGDDLKNKMDEDRRRRLEKMLRIARIFMDDAVVKRITVSDARLEAEALNDSLRVLVPDFTVNIYDIGYSIRDSLPHYNDSVFHFLFRDVAVRIPEAATSLRVDEVKAEPNGVIDISNARVLSFLDEGRRQSIVGSVEHIGVGGFDVAKFNTIKEMQIRNVHLYNPSLSVVADETIAPPPSSSPLPVSAAVLEQDNLLTPDLEVARQFITGLTVDTVFIHDASTDFRSLSTALSVRTDSLSLAVYGVGFSLINEVPYHYNDSVYQFFLGHADIVTPDSLMRITASHIRYDNGGAFSLGPTRIRHIVDKWSLAHRMGDVPSSWMDLSLNSLRTSSKNILKEVFTVSQGFFLDSLSVDIRSLRVFRDARFNPREPYSLPQKGLLSLSYPFVIRRVDARIGQVAVETALSEKSVGTLALNGLRVRVHNVTAVPSSVISVFADGRLGKGKMHARFDMTVNPACDWRIRLSATDLNTHVLDNMIYPLVGMKIGCDVHRLTADYKGNSQVANGTFCMQYDNLDIRAFKDSDSPFSVVGDLSGLINSAGKTLVNKSNPSKPGKAPLSYQVTWKNDPWSDPALFYIGPVIHGCVETLLPGLFIHRRIKTD